MCNEPTRILFIQGFATCRNELDCDDYANIRLFFKGNPQFCVDFLEYDTHESVSSVDLRIRDQIDQLKPSILIGHSMGGYFVFNHIRRVVRNMTESSTYRGYIPSRIILLMPFLEASPLLETIVSLKLPSFIIDRLNIPLGLIIPASQSHDRGNIMNTQFNPICFKQPIQITQYLPTPNDILQVFGTTISDVQVMFSTDEVVTKISNTIISSIPKEKIKYVYGKHSAFRSQKTNFFEVFEKMIESTTLQVNDITDVRTNE